MKKTKRKLWLMQHEMRYTETLPNQEGYILNEGNRTGSITSLFNLSLRKFQLKFVCHPSGT